MRDADAMNCVPLVEWSVANMRTRGRLMWAWGAVLGVMALAVAVGGVWAWLTSGTVLRLSAQRALALLE